MPRLQKSRSRYDLTIDSDGDNPIYLMFDRGRFKDARVKIQARYVPNEPGAESGVSLQEWSWSNGPAGAGTTIETPVSYAGGACEYGEFVCLRRKGVAQPAGKLTELGLPGAVTGLTTGRPYRSAVFGGDLFITTVSQYLVRVPDCKGVPEASGTADPVTYHNFGTGYATSGIATWRRSSTDYLIVASTGTGLLETTDAATWSAGASGTERSLLETVYWTIGDQLATGGLAGTTGTGANRLIGTQYQGRGFYHVAGDPKVSANWSSLTDLGPSPAGVQAIAAGNRAVFFSTGAGVYGVDALGYSPNLTRWVASNAHELNGQQAVLWDGKIWYAHVLGLAAFEPDGRRIDYAQFHQFGGGTGMTPIYGRPRALCASEEGLWVGYYNEETQVSYIGMLVKDPDGTYRWSMAEAVIPNQEITLIHQVTGSDTYPRVFYGTIDTAGRHHLYVQWLPRSGDPETDFVHSGPYQAAENWSVTLSRTDGGRNVKKTWRLWMLQADNLGSAYPENSVDFQVSADGGAYTSQGVASEAPQWESTPRTAFVRSTNAQIKLVVHNHLTAPVILRSASARYTPHPRLAKSKTYPVVFGEGVTGQDPATVLALLEAAQDRGPLTCLDELGRTVTALVEPGINETVEEQETGKGFLVHADVTLSTTQEYARWDVDSWDAGGVFG